MNVLVHKIVKLCKPVKRLEWWGFALSHSLMECRLTGPSSSPPWPFTLWFSAFPIFRMKLFWHWRHMYASCLRAGGRKEADWCGDRSLTPAGTDPQRTVWQPRATQPAARGLFKIQTQVYIVRKILISFFSTRIKYEQMPGTRDRWDFGFHRCIYSRSIVILIDCLQSFIYVQCPQWKRTIVMRELRNRGSAHSRTLAGQMRTTEDVDTAETTTL